LCGVGVIEELLSKGPGIGARMIVVPKSDAQFDRSRLRVVHKNRKKGRKTHVMSLVAAIIWSRRLISCPIGVPTSPGPGSPLT
jgi:hypothetical protein